MAALTATGHQPPAVRGVVAASCVS